MRTFIAIDLPEKIKNKIAELENDLKKCDLAFRWVKPENLHLTLKFLGDISQEQVSKIKEAITKISGKFATFKANFNGFGFFPNARRPRVFFISIEKGELFRSIARELEEELETLGFDKENRFKSHITLARIKDLKNIESLKVKIKDTQLDEKFLIPAIILYKSTLAKEGPIYGEIARSNLRNKQPST